MQYELLAAFIDHLLSSVGCGVIDVWSFISSVCFSDVAETVSVIHYNLVDTLFL